LSTPFEHRYADLPGVRLHYVLLGRLEAPTVLLVHGWPQTWFEWRAPRSSRAALREFLSQPVRPG
jgi:pimeloyl-ACP methyl ester carboxylesterase